MCDGDEAQIVDDILHTLGNELADREMVLEVYKKHNRAEDDDFEDTPYKAVYRLVLIYS